MRQDLADSRAAVSTNAASDSSNSQGLQSCLDDAQQAAILAPALNGGANLQARIDLCKAKYPSN